MLLGIPRVPLWVVLGTLVVAPWLYAGLMPWVAVTLGLAGSWIGLSWLIQFLRRRRADSVPLRALLSVLLLVLAGWLATGRSVRLPLDVFAERHLAEIAADWPASFVAVEPLSAMLAWTGALGVLMFAMDAELGWRERMIVLRGVIVSAGALALVGGILLVVNQPWIFRGARSPLAGATFATFFDAGIGVAFLSLTWPLAAAAFLTETEGAWRTVTAGAVTACWFALGALGSLAGIMVGAAVWLGFGGWMLWRVPVRALGSLAKRAGVLVLVCGVATVGGMAAAGRAPEWRSPWSVVQAKLKAEATEAVKIGEYAVRAAKRPDGIILSDDDPADPAFVSRQRAKLRSACLSMLTSAGLLGFGVGTWRITFPHFCEDALMRTHYLQVQFAGNDFWQMLVEWGAVGAIGWVMLFHGGFAAALYRLRRYRSKGGAIGQREGIVVGAALGLLSLLACSLRSFPLQVPAIQLHAMFLLGLLWAARGRVGSEPADSTQDSIPKGVAT